MDEKEIRSFLVQQPRGAKILVKTEDDEVHELAAPGTAPGARGGSSWANVARSVVALCPVLIEVHDAQGKLIRACRPNEDVKTTEHHETRLPVLHTDPETARLTHFANLLFRAHEFATGVAFTKMTDLFGMLNERTISLETRLERAESNYRREMQSRLDEAFDRADQLAEEAERQAREGNPSDPLTEFAKGFLQARNNGAPPTTAPTNGKAQKS